MTQADHGARAHATWSASSTAANIACPGRLALISDLPERPESREAAWGTACHQIAETCLRDGQDAVSFVGRIVETKAHQFEVDEEMAETVQVYVDYVHSGELHAFDGNSPDSPSKSQFHVEQHFSLAPLQPPFDAGGTCDAVIYFALGKLVEVVDLKGGRGVVVEAKGNAQLRTYALGAMLANPGLDVDRITVTIVQPRAPHKDGRIRSETFHVADLIDWTTDLVAAMNMSEDARRLLLGLVFGSEAFLAWAKMWLRAGDHCKFCPAADFCPALERAALTAAEAWFSSEGTVEITPTQPAEMAPERVAAILDKADLLEGWLNAVRARGQWLAESGVVVPGYQLVDKQARRKYRDEAAIEDRLAFLGVDAAKSHDVKLKTPAQMQKALDKDDFEALADLIEKPITGQNLVACAKSTRPAVPPPATKFFGPNA